MTAGGKAVNISVPRANPDVTGPDVRSAMERILNAGIILTAAGEPDSIGQADLIYTEELEYSL